jgi:hypothetical protein
VGYARRNFMVAVPRAVSWETLNAQLVEGCRRRRQRKLWGHHETIAERYERDRERWLLCRRCRWKPVGVASAPP